MQYFTNWTEIHLSSPVEVFPSYCVLYLFFVLSTVSELHTPSFLIQVKQEIHWLIFSCLSRSRYRDVHTTLRPHFKFIWE